MNTADEILLKRSLSHRQLEKVNNDSAYYVTELALHFAKTVSNGVSDDIKHELHEGLLALSVSAKLQGCLIIFDDEVTCRRWYFRSDSSIGYLKKEQLPNSWGTCSKPKRVKVA